MTVPIYPFGTPTSPSLPHILLPASVNQFNDFKPLDQLVRDGMTERQHYYYEGVAPYAVQEEDHSEDDRHQATTSEA
jgi:hypothetical protein